MPSDDIFAIDPQRLVSVKAVLTVMGGRTTWRAPGFGVPESGSAGR